MKNKSIVINTFDKIITVDVTRKEANNRPTFRRNEIGLAVTATLNTHPVAHVKSII